MTTSYGFWTDERVPVYFKKKNIFVVDFDFNPPGWTEAEKDTHFLNGPDGDPANGYHPDLTRDAFDKMINMIERIKGRAIYAKSVDLPSFSIAPEGDPKKRNTIASNGTVTVAAGILDWNPINITLVDVLFGDPEGPPFSPIAAVQAAIFLAIGDTASQHGADAVNPLMQQLVLGDITIRMLDGSGKTADMWKLSRCWITSMSYGTLSYEDDSVNELTLTLDYIKAQYAVFDGEDPNPIWVARGKG